MLTNIENRLEELFEQIEMMPQDKVEAAEKVRKLKNIRLKRMETFVIMMMHVVKFSKIRVWQILNSTAIHVGMIIFLSDHFIIFTSFFFFHTSCFDNTHHID